MSAPIGCSCQGCTAACVSKPGWFAYSEAEHVAKLLDMPLELFFKMYLAVDWYEPEGAIQEDVFVLAPVIVGENAGDMYPADPRGRCVFLDHMNRCKIHAVKPRECREMLHSDTRKQMEDRKIAITLTWQGHEDQIKKLLGRAPVSKEYHGGFFGGLGSAFGGDY